MSTETASKKYQYRGDYNPVRKGPPNRKASMKLAARVHDWAQMYEKANDPVAFASRFHMPGSTQGPR